MGKLIYSITTSIDGFVADKNDNFEWTKPTEEILSCVNDSLSNVGTFLFGRRMYETMAVWDTISENGESVGFNKFAKLWRAANKVVYSTSLLNATTANTTLEREFSTEAIQKLVLASDKDFNIGGPHLTAEAVKADIVDEYHQYIAPLILGSGNHWLPQNVKVKLELMSLQKFENGTVHLQYKKA
jgi:dihydrofolate reductase